MTVSVCLKCGEIKGGGAWTACLACGHTPETLDDKAKHVMTSDHYFSAVELEGISMRVKSGQPMRFDEQQVESLIATLKTIDGKKVGWFVFGSLAIVVAAIGAAIYLLGRLVSR